MWWSGSSGSPSRRASLSRPSRWGELAEASRREENSALFDTLPDTTVSTEEIVAALAKERPER